MSEPSQFYGDFMQTAEQAFPCPAPWRHQFVWMGTKARQP
jgi:hypothetical protein